MNIQNEGEIMDRPHGSYLDVAVQQPKIDGYNEFMSWRRAWNINSFTEEVFMEFFREVAKTLAPDSIPTVFTTLKEGMQSIYNVNISSFTSLMGFLSQNGLIGPKKSIDQPKSVAAGPTIDFSNDEIRKFLTEAPDSEYLAIKTATVVGMHVDCIFTDVRLIRVNMIETVGKRILVRIPPTQTGASKVYPIRGEFAAIVRKYLQLRLRAPSEVKTDFFLIQYQNGKCGNVNMGRGTIRKMARQIAIFLKLENVERYTTGSFRMISSKSVDRRFNTEGSRSTIPACNITASPSPVATLSNVEVKKAKNSTVNMRQSSKNAENYDNAIDVDTDCKISQAEIDESRSVDDGNIIVCTNESTRSIVVNNCTASKQQLHSTGELVCLSSSKSNEIVYDPNAGINAKIRNSNATATHRMFQSKIDEQAREIVRLKQLIEKERVQNEVLKDLLKESMQRNAATGYPWQDLKDDYGKGGYEHLTSLKKTHPHLKVTLAIGGWNEGSKNYSIMAADPSRRKRFVKSAVDFVRKFNFDGLDLDWEYPTQREGAPEDRENFVHLVRELKDAMKPHNLILTSAIGASTKVIDEAYNVRELSNYLDFLHIMCYDYGGNWDRKVTANAPLRSDDDLNVEKTIKHLLKLGASPSKIVMGVPFYGRTFVTHLDGNYGDASTEVPFQGPFTRENGFLGYNEICALLSNRSAKWTTTWDSDISQAKAVLRDEETGETKVVVYDSTRSVAKKMRFAMEYKLGGIMTWSIDTDDFLGDCDVESETYDDFGNVAGVKLTFPKRVNSNYPLLRTINEGIIIALDEIDQENAIKASEADNEIPHGDENGNRNGANLCSAVPTNALVVVGYMSCVMLYRFL